MAPLAPAHLALVPAPTLARAPVARAAVRPSPRLALAPALALTLVLAACRGGGGGGATASSALDQTQQPVALAGATLSARGGDGGEGIDGGDGGQLEVQAATISCRLAGSARLAGEYDGATVTPADPDRLAVAAGASVTMTSADLAAGPGGVGNPGQPWSSVAIDGTLIVDVGAGPEAFTIEVAGDCRIAGRIEVLPATARADLTLEGGGAGSLAVTGTVDLRASAGGAGAPRFASTGFAEALVRGAIDCSGHTAADASDGGDIDLTVTGFAVVEGSLQADGGSGGEDPANAGVAGAGGRIAIDADTVVLRGPGVQTFGGQGGAFNPVQPQITPGDGGAGGSVDLEATGSLEVLVGFVLRASGGRANGPGGETRQGGDGGEVSLRAGAGEGLRFGGAIESIGGFSPFGQAGAGGLVLLSAEPGATGTYEVTGSVLALGGAALGGSAPGGAAAGGQGGQIEVEVRGASGALALGASLSANGGPAVSGAAAPGAGGVVFAGAGRLPAQGLGYDPAVGHSIAVTGVLRANGGGAATAAERGAGGLVDLNAADLDLGGVLEAVGGTPPALGRTLTRTGAVLGALFASVIDDDADADGFDGHLDRADLRP